MKYEIGDRFRAPTMDKMEGLGFIESYEMVVSSDNRDIYLKVENIGKLCDISDIDRTAKIYKIKWEDDWMWISEVDLCKYFTKIEELTASQKLDICRQEIAESLAKYGASIEIDISKTSKKISWDICLVAKEGGCKCWIYGEEESNYILNEQHFFRKKNQKLGLKLK